MFFDGDIVSDDFFSHDDFEIDDLDSDDDTENYEERFSRILFVKDDPSYWNRMVECRDYLQHQPSAELSLKYISALFKLCERYPIIYRKYSICFSIGVFLEFILPKVNGVKKVMNIFHKKLRDLVNLIKLQRLQILLKQQVYLPSSYTRPLVKEVTIFFKNKKFWEKTICLIFSFLCIVEMPSRDDTVISVIKILDETFPRAGPYGPYKVMVPDGWRH